MTKKFTEEEFQHMVEMEGMYVFTDLEYQRQALRNPITREWARAKFVEEEKKYYWITKKVNSDGKPLTLMHGANGVVQMRCPLDLLTRYEVVEWGFNPDKYIYTSDREYALELAEGLK